MKILHLTKRFPNAVGGDGVVVSHLVQQQRLAGHKAFILTSNCSSILQQAYVKKFGLPIKDASIDKISIGRILTLAGMLVYAFWFLRKIRPDIVHSHTMDFGFAVSFAARAYRIPIINTCHSVTFTQSQFSPIKRNLEKWLLLNAHYNAVITVDATAIEPLKHIGIKPVYFLANGVEVGEFKTRRQAKDDTYRIVFVGRLVKEKGLEYLLRALPSISDAIAPYKLTVVGDGNMMPDFIKLTKDLGLQKNVKFVGRKHGSRLKWYYEGADLFVMPSLHEAFPLVVLEAMAAGLPIVATNVGSTPTFCTDHKDSIIVKAGDSQALGKAIVTVRKNPKLAARIAANGRALVETKYTYKKVASNLQKIYDEVLA